MKCNEIPRTFSLAALLPVVVLLTGCPLAGNGGSNENTNANESQNDNQNDSGASSVSFSADVLPLLAARCASCHRPGGMADTAGVPLYLDSGDVHGALVNQPSLQDAGLTLVVPGDAEASLLYQKVSSASPPVGLRMPLFAAPLSEAQIALIAEWIDAGAADN